jgi:hypothetical protein
MASTIVFLAAFALAIYASLLIWRSSRRLSPAGSLKDVTVSREWLLHHQAAES